ncbi:MAG: hypothetical protein AAFZ07_09610 [Actinomycetota bacterium]
MTRNAVLSIDGVDAEGAVSEAALVAALQRSEEFVRVRIGASSMDAAPVDGGFALLATAATDRRAGTAAERLVTLDEAVSALLAHASGDGATPSSPSTPTRREHGPRWGRPRLDRETRISRAVTLPLVLVVAGVIATVVGVRTEASSDTGEPHVAALIAGTVCYFAWLAAVLMFTMPDVRHRLERWLDVEIQDFDGHQNMWRVVDRGRYGAKLVVFVVLLGFGLSFFLVPLAIVVAAVALA